jgi:hypothetical protein
MYTRQRVWIVSTAALSFVVGLIFVLNHISIGWMFFILALGYLAASTQAGQAWVATNPRLIRRILIIAAVLLLVLIAVFAAFILWA